MEGWKQQKEKLTTWRIVVARTHTHKQESFPVEFSNWADEIFFFLPSSTTTHDMDRRKIKQKWDSE